MLSELGADVFFNEFHKNAATDQLRDQIDQIMVQIINAGPSPYASSGAGGPAMNPFAT